MIKEHPLSADAGEVDAIITQLRNNTVAQTTAPSLSSLPIDGVNRSANQRSTSGRMVRVIFVALTIICLAEIWLLVRMYAPTVEVGNIQSPAKKTLIAPVINPLLPPPPVKGAVSGSINGAMSPGNPLISSNAPEPTHFPLPEELKGMEFP